MVAVVKVRVRVRWSCLRVEVSVKAKRRYRHHLHHLHHLHHHHHHLHHHPLSRSEAVTATAMLRAVGCIPGPHRCTRPRSSP